MLSDDDQDAVFQALANPARRQMLDLLRQQPGLAVGKLAGQFDVSRVAVIKHLAVLEAAELVVSKRAGRRRLLFLNVVPIQQIHERWTDEYSAHWAHRPERQTGKGVGR